MLRPLCRDRVVGIDFSQGMLTVCRHLLADVPGTAGCDLVRGNVLALPFEAPFDIVTCFGALGHIRRCEEPSFVAEIARVLRPGGQFVFVTSSCAAVLVIGVLVFPVVQRSHAPA